MQRQCGRLAEISDTAAINSELFSDSKIDDNRYVLILKRTRY